MKNVFFLSILLSAVFLKAPAQTSETIAIASGSAVSELTASDCARERIAGRVVTPILFSVRDSLFMNSLPEDEPATVTLRLTVSKSGKVRDKKTVVASNHACYVGKPFVAATKELTIPRVLLNGARQDTVIEVTIGLVYTLALHTKDKEWPSMEPNPMPFYFYGTGTDNSAPIMVKNYEERTRIEVAWANIIARDRYREATPTPVWYYVATLL